MYQRIILNNTKFIYVCTNHFTPDCFLNEGHFKAGFVKKKKKPQGWISTHCSLEVSLTLDIFYDYLRFHRREGLGESRAL